MSGALLFYLELKLFELLHQVTTHGLLSLEDRDSRSSMTRSKSPWARVSMNSLGTVLKSSLLWFVILSTGTSRDNLVVLELTGRLWMLRPIVVLGPTFVYLRLRRCWLDTLGINLDTFWGHGRWRAISFINRFEILHSREDHFHIVIGELSSMLSTACLRFWVNKERVNL